MPLRLADGKEKNLMQFTNTVSSIIPDTYREVSLSQVRTLNASHLPPFQAAMAYWVTIVDVLTL